MDATVVFDCEFLAIEGSLSRYWCGSSDPDPVVAQIGAVKIGLSDDFPILETLRVYVAAKDRFGASRLLDPYFTALTGITDQTIASKGVPLAEALDALKAFAADAKLWSWGKDELHMIAISCYVEGLAPPLPAGQFGNARWLLAKAGMPEEEIDRTQSNALSAYFNIEHPPLRGHDALDDALSIGYALQHLMRTGALTPPDFR